jgi:hypothetical protein
MKNQTIVAVIISLVVGLGLGYAVWGTQAKAPAMTSNGMMHQMPCGSVLAGKRGVVR